MPTRLERLQRVLWIPVTAVALAWALSLTPLYQRLDILSMDGQMRVAAREHFFQDALVVDIDDASLRALQPFFGSWPYKRDTYALLLDYLGEMGARTVAFDILFADAREGDERLRSALARNPNVVLAATASNDHPDEVQMGHALDEAAWRVPTRLAAQSWPALLLPLTSFTQELSPYAGIGVVSVVPDSDGVLRRLPLFHQFNGQHVPALPLAAQFAGRPRPPVEAGAGIMRVGAFSWPTDESGAVHLYYPRNRNSVLSMPFSRVAQAMLGLPGQELAASTFRGKTIFVGSSAFLSDRVLTPVGEMNGLYVLAIAHQALAHNLVLTPRTWRWTGALLIIALLPSLLLLWQPRRSALSGAALGVGAALAVYLAHLALIHWLKQESSLLLPLLVVLFANLLETMRALTLMNAEQKAKIHLLANDDPLTGLPNRFSLQAQLAQAIGHGRYGSSLAVLLIDLDRFKAINDTLGHQVGDELLVEASTRIRSSVRPHDLVARLGGDEFCIVALDVDEAGAVQCAEKLIAALAQPYRIAGQELHSTSSVGISRFPVDGRDVATLLKHADTAMYRAKAQGRNTYQFFTPELAQGALDRLALENNLRNALRAGELELHFQPQTDMNSGRVVAVEALLRWHHPTLGLLAPDDFIPIAEESGLILPIGNWVLRTACAQLHAWQLAGINHIQRVAVNLSARQFEQPQLPALISEALAQAGLAPSQLELEITESVAMKNPEKSIEILHTLKRMGVELAVDDFGTGHSSLTYLKSFPINCLKIDRSFVRDIETDGHDAEICSATVALAHKLGLQVVAEGVETQGQFDFLRNIHCGKAQGFLISRPVPASEIPALLQSPQSP